MSEILYHKTHPTLESLLKQLHFEEDSDEADIAQELLEEATEIACPKTLINIIPVKLNEETVTLGDVEITYPYVRKMLVGTDKVAVYISTCGT
ncbi:MAG: hypothetical protein J6B51_03370, partial [Clostridia bacterium]|nr:hypothetical protein [Clostridia bacterium]